MEPLALELIVVGVDGSPSSGEALDWAVAEARLTGATIDAVYVWDPAPIFTSGISDREFDALRKAAEERATEIVHELAHGEQGVTIVPRVLMGNAAQALLDAAADADLLVVGSRGLGGLKGMLLGSVGHHCAAHSRCPVVIVRHTSLRRRHEPLRRGLRHEPVEPAVHGD